MLDALIVHQPVQHFRGAIGAVAELRWLEVEAFNRALEDVKNNDPSLTEPTIAQRACRRHGLSPIGWRAQLTSIHCFDNSNRD